jgi:hypothetical protein
MSGEDSGYKIAFALQQTNSAMSMRLIEAALRHEMKFQDERVNRPIETDGYIPGLGEVIDTIAVCRKELVECWEALNRKDPSE